MTYKRGVTLPDGYVVYSKSELLNELSGLLIEKDLMTKEDIAFNRGVKTVIQHLELIP
jgi:hypothetical protein